MDTTFIATDIMTALPEVMLAVGAMALLMYGVFRGERSADTVGWLSVILLILAAVVVVLVTPESATAFGGSFVVDSFSHFMKVLTLVASAVAIIMSVRFVKTERFQKFEYPILIVLATLGMLMMISAADLIALYMGLELQSLSLYVIASINRDSLRSTEAGLKYFVLGALSSGMLLYGCSLVLRLHRSHGLRTDRRGPCQGRRQCRHDFRSGVHHGRSGVQGFRGSVPYVDAGRL